MPTFRHLLVAACTAVTLTSSAVSGRAADTFLKLDFTNTGGVYTTGFDPVFANFLALTPNTGLTNIDGTGINFSINNVGAYQGGSASTEPLTSNGFYTFDNQNNVHDFTLTGLAAGSTVTLYAVSAWDGVGRGAYVNFGSGFTKAQAIGDPGTVPTLANFTQINPVPLVVDVTGTATGFITGENGTAIGEGQVGGFIFDVGAPAAVPEPATWAAGLLMSLSGIGLLICRRRPAMA